MSNVPAPWLGMGVPSPMDLENPEGCPDWTRECPCKHQRVLPGQGIRLKFKVTALVSPLSDQYAPASAPGLAVTIYLPDSTEATPSVVNDALGYYHVDYVVPLTAPPGVALYRAQASGGTPAQNFTEQGKFHVRRLSFP